MVQIGLLCKEIIKNINMKQLLSLFLFLLPCLAWAQYPSNGNQKITLGEQTTADGLIYRGVLADTVRKPSIDTMAYMVLDTTTNIIWHYKKATSNAWLRLNLLPSDTAAIAYVNTYGTQTVNGAKTFTSAVTATRFNPTSSTVTGTGLFLPTTNTLGFSINGVERVRIKSDGNVGFGTNNPVSILHIEKAGGTTLSSGDQFRVSSGVSGNRAEFHFTDNITSDAFLSFLPSATIASRYLEITLNGSAGGLVIDGNGKVGILTVAPTQVLHVVGNARITAMNGIGDIGADANGVLQAATSDMNLKNTIENSPFGLNEILLLNPVTFLYNDKDRKIDSDVKEVGFIAQDVFDIIPNAVSSTGTGDLQLDYRAITATLTKAIQEQQALIKALEQRIINLENK
jgi:hypothetical protein